ncbi:MAG TPA: DUF2235 domain-containing protein [Xanthobacteraceae bacterium]|nr:DUF2235 domain-containing protein [Xanthobacteraceae bacterium]
MSKKIVFCADGTWNGPSEPDHDDKSAPPTNVFKSFLNLDGRDEPGSTLLENEQERSLQDANGAIAQIAKYLNGVGDSDNFLVKALGGTLGAGLITRIVRGYTFLSRNYADGDDIFLLGFSRGAYTARALAGLVATKGLLDARKLDLTDKEMAYRLGAAVWFQYRAAARQQDANWLAKLEDAVVDLPSFVLRPPPDDQLLKARINTIAVWDTVGALGIPAYTAKDVRIDVFQFADTKLSPIVQRGFQAIAIDEQRADFTPTLWDDDPRIVQVLFPGAHADVGGGYPMNNNQSGLSDCTLKWITDELAKLGVRFSSSLTFVPAPDPKGVGHRPWDSPPWTGLPRGSRAFPAGLSLAQCVLDRMTAGAVCAAPGAVAGPYGPTNLSGYLAGSAAAPGIAVV